MSKRFKRPFRFKESLVWHWMKSIIVVGLALGWFALIIFGYDHRDTLPTLDLQTLWDTYIPKNLDQLFAESVPIKIDQFTEELH